MRSFPISFAAILSITQTPVRTALGKAKIALMTKGLGEARKEVVLCDDISERSVRMKEKMRAVREERSVAGREKGKENVRFRRDLGR